MHFGCWTGGVCLQIFAAKETSFSDKSLLKHPYNVLMFHLKHFIFGNLQRNLNKLKFILQEENTISSK